MSKHPLAIAWDKWLASDEGRKAGRQPTRMTSLAWGNVNTLKTGLLERSRQDARLAHSTSD